MINIKDALKYPNAPIIDYTLSKTQTFEHKNILEFLNGFHGDITKCKLGLRSLQDLTHEEKQHILNNFAYNTQEDQSLITETFYHFSEILTYCRPDKIVELVNYLRDQNIMIETEDWFALEKAIKL